MHTGAPGQRRWRLRPGCGDVSLVLKRIPGKLLSMVFYKSLLQLCATLLLGFLAVSEMRAAESPEKEAQKAAEDWLGLTDTGKFAASWEGAAAAFRAAVSKDQWQSSLDAVRTPLGRLLARRLKSAQYTKTLPGAADGEYVILQFDSSFAHKKQAIETVTPMREKDGAWRVSGYYIK